MPLSEFLRVARRNLVADQLNPSQADLPPRPNDELFELVCNNGEIVMQAQSSKPPLNFLSPNIVVHDSRILEFGGVEPFFNEVWPLVPASDINLNRVDEMVPWIGYPMNDPLPQGYGSERLSETSGITSNGMSTGNSFLSVDKSGSGPTVVNFQSGGNYLNSPSSEAHPMRHSLLSQQSQTLDAIVSGVSDSNNKFINQAEDKVPEDLRHHSKRKPDEVESECRTDDLETEVVGSKKHIAARRCNGSKRSRAAEVHNLSERRRRDRINERMRSLQKLIPNCNKSDKASMLDEAIEYLKNLQLQIQMLSSMGAKCISPMMFPPGMQHMHLVHYSAMGAGMGMMGMNVGGSLGCPPIYPVPPMHYPSPKVPRNPCQNLAVYGQGLTSSGQKPPLHPLPRRHIPFSALSNEKPNTSPICNPEAGTSMTYSPNQLRARNDDMNQSAVNIQSTNDTVSAPADMSIGPGYV